MSNIIAISATIVMCMNGPVSKDNKCEDGTKPIKPTVNILTGTTGCTKPFSALKECVNSWDTVFEIEDSGRKLFVLFPDGRIESAPDFKVEQAARAFWQAMKLTYPEFDPLKVDVH